MAKYNNFIELSPHYESVVDIGSDSRNPDMWHEYIVHEDMITAMDKICDSLKYEDPDKRRSFWIYGSYGTGKSYAGIVLKHLFEDNIENVRKFLSKQVLIPYRERFLAFREKGDFLVIWKSQTTGIRNSTQLLMTMELAIRERLKEKYGDKAYYGENSLIGAAKNAVTNSFYNWEAIFNNSYYGLSEDYASVEEFRERVLEGSIKECNTVANICRDNGWAFFNDKESFQNWIADVIEGNELQETGIVFIWDEFTSYLREYPNDDALQPLSEFCKQQPFFMFLIVHRDQSWVGQMGEESYERITHRFHELRFTVSESAAYELIGNSILIRPGMEEKWKEQQDAMMKMLRPSMGELAGLDFSGNQTERYKKLCPLHPMTLSMLAIVAENFSASQRTLFRFLKDTKEAEQKVGFVYYINNYGPDDWPWLTPDFLWDYFFTRESDIRNFSDEAKSAYKHYAIKREYIGNDNLMHVFKASMLLIALVSGGNISNLRSQTRPRGITATKSTLYKCFAGILTKSDIDLYLSNLSEIDVLRLDHMTNGDMRIQIPYSGNADVFDIKRQEIVKNNTRYRLFKKDGKEGIFGNAMVKQIESIWHTGSGSLSRMYIRVCDSGTQSVEQHLKDLKTDLTKNAYKFGLLVIAIQEVSQFTALQEKVKEIAQNDETGRLAVCLLREPLTDEQLNLWYDARTHMELANEEQKTADGSRYEDEASTVMMEWCTSAADGKIMAAWKNTLYPSEYGIYSFSEKLQRDIIYGRIFTAAPEKLIATTTVYKSVNRTAALDGIQKKATNAQTKGIEDALRSAKLWDVEGLKVFAQCTGSPATDAIAQVAVFLQEQFSQGTQIRLDELWHVLQTEPYGYSSNIVSAYLLGFLLREFVNSDFTWNDGANPQFLNEANLAQMITMMCKGGGVNQYLSPGSEMWKKFKGYVQKIFRLQDQEVINEKDARKFVRQRYITVGVPFWVLKYLSEDEFGGSAFKQTAVEIIELFDDFLAENGDQDKLMSEMIAKFKGKGKLRVLLADLYADQKKMFAAFETFILSESPELQEIHNNLGLNQNDINDEIHRLMQGQVYTWTEEEVKEKLEVLCINYRAVMALNTALGCKEKNIDALKREMSNAFSTMKIPGSVMERMNYPWVHALKTMRQVSREEWSVIDLKVRTRYTELWQESAQDAWQNVVSQKSILRDYMDEHKYQCTEQELNSIYDSLQFVSYDDPANYFDNKIKRQMGQVAYSRNSSRLQQLWKEQSGFESVKEWCNYYCVPIQWVVAGEAAAHVGTIKSIQDMKKVGETDLNNAVQYFEGTQIAVLKNKKAVMDSFFAQIGESYRTAFETSGDMLFKRLKTSDKLTSNVYEWANQVGEIRKVLDKYLQDKYCKDAKARVSTMPEAELRDRVKKLLDAHPDMYTLFMK